jgi:hypothetical protein
MGRSHITEGYTGKEGIFRMQSARLLLTTATLASTAALAQPAGALSPMEAQACHMAMMRAATSDTTKLNATKAVLRDLWIGHIFWVRNVVVAELAGDATAQVAAEKQVVDNAQSIAHSIEPFYGKPAAERLFTLLAGHYGAVNAYLDASIAKDDGKQSEATTSLMSNAAEIAVFLSSANQYLPKNDVEGLLQAHASHHIIEIQQLLARDYAGEAQTWADMSQHMYVIADAIVDGLAKQFPDKLY